MRAGATTLLALALMGCALADEEWYYSTWTYTTDDCSDNNNVNLIRTENYKLFECFKAESGTFAYNCDTVNGVQRADYDNHNCSGDPTWHTVTPLADLDTCEPDGKGYYLKQFCADRERYYAVSGDLVLYERLNQPLEGESCDEFPTYIRGTQTRSCIHDSENDLSYVYYCDAGGMSRATFQGPNCQGVGVVMGKHLGADSCVDADEMPFLDATTGYGSFTCVSNVYEFDNDNDGWSEQHTAVSAATYTFAALAGVMLTYLAYRWTVRNCWKFEERISDPALKPVALGSPSSS